MSRHATISLRKATGNDAEGMAAVHHAAVYKTGATTYPPELLKHWSGPLNAERITDIRVHLESGSSHYLVAETEGIVVGFSSIDLQSRELRGPFINPDFGREGIGSELVAALEDVAAERGFEELFVDASLNAEHFFAELGYELLGENVSTLPDGTELPTKRMHKKIEPGD